MKTSMGRLLCTSHPASPLHLFILLVLLAGSKPLASEGLLVALLHLDVAALQLERPGECTARAHTRKVLCCVNSEYIAHHLGEYR